MRPPSHQWPPQTSSSVLNSARDGTSETHVQYAIASECTTHSQLGHLQNAINYSRAPQSKTKAQATDYATVSRRFESVLDKVRNYNCHIENIEYVENETDLVISSCEADDVIKQKERNRDSINDEQAQRLSEGQAPQVRISADLKGKEVRYI